MPASPCNDVCEIDRRSGWCKGCGRTLDEIAAWRNAAPDRQRRILSQLPQRLSKLAAKDAAGNVP